MEIVWNTQDKEPYPTADMETAMPDSQDPLLELMRIRLVLKLIQERGEILPVRNQQN